MREIPLSQGFTALVDNEDFDAVMAAGSWCVLRGHRTDYARRTVGAGPHKRTVLLHTLLTGWALADHIDGNGLNNCRSNLRVASQAQNARNTRRRMDNTSGYKGVSWHKDREKWVAYVRRDGKLKHLGCFADAVEAALAYDAAALTLHGPFASLNFPTARAAS